MFWDITSCSPLKVNRLGLPPAFTLVSCSTYSTLKMEALCSSETPADFQRTRGRYIRKASTLHNHRRDNLKFLKKKKLKFSNYII
jgi:hypothetical protein